MTIKEITKTYPVMKMHGCGNDFVVLSDFDENLLPDQVKAICSRHYGVGSDGLISVVKSRTPAAPWRMKFFNPDGSTAEMCGNGIRCFAKYLSDQGLVEKKGPLPVDTDAGIITPEIIDNSDHLARVRVNMGAPELHNDHQISLPPDEQGIVRGKAAGRDFTFVSMGNPHAIVFTQTPETEVTEFGPAIEKNTTIFPQKVNVEFIKMIKPDELLLHVWERGAGITLACGTGACAGFVAAVLNNHSSTSALIHLPGGDLSIAWEGPDTPVFMTGNAVNVFQIDPGSLDRFLV